MFNWNHQSTSSTSHPKNVELVSISGGQQQYSSTNKEVMKVTNFIQQTMTTLLDYNKKFKNKFNIDMIQAEVSFI